MLWATPGHQEAQDGEDKRERTHMKRSQSLGEAKFINEPTAESPVMIQAPRRTTPPERGAIATPPRARMMSAAST
jgi:hypothetical protein